jgi:hypothetical protein
MNDPIKITSGSDAVLQFAFTDDEEPPQALPITSPTIIEETGDLEGRCIATLVDGPNGLATVTIEGTDPIATGIYFVRLQVTLSDGNTLASERLLVDVR